MIAADGFQGEKKKKKWQYAAVEGHRQCWFIGFGLRDWFIDFVGKKVACKYLICLTASEQMGGGGGQEE